MRFPGRSTVAALVIVLMALSSAAPLAYTHQHEVTACDDDARDAHHHHHQHGHGHCHSHCHAKPGTRPVAAMLSPYTHEHVMWWGIEIVVPSEPSGDSPSRIDTTHLGVLNGRANTATIDLAPATASIILFAAVASFDEPISTAVLLEHAPASRPECNLLCDTARFERSGVQLA